MQNKNRSMYSAAGALLGLVVSSGFVHAQVAPGQPNPNNPYGQAGSVFSTIRPSVDPASPYSTMPGPGFFPPYYPGYGTYYGQEGGFLIGASQVMQAQGQLMLDNERARILREAANSAYLDTRKKQFDLEKYIRDNTPTFTQEQAKIAAERLRRIQDAATPGEIESGKALNTLLRDLMKHPTTTTSYDDIVLSEDVLRRLNVAPPSSNGNLGVLRNDGRFTWPIALLDVVPEEEREKISINTEEAVRQAASGKVNPNILKELSAKIRQIRDDLTAKVNSIPTGQYIQGKRFLTSFDAAIQALSTDNFASHFFKYQKFASGGRKVRELVDFMRDNGLQFAPSTPGDEAAYQSLYTVLANYDIAINTRVANKD